MATKKICDGCGRDITRDVTGSIVTVSYGEHQNNPKAFDLCKSCANHFDSNLPTNWARADTKSAA